MLYNPENGYYMFYIYVFVCIKKLMDFKVKLKKFIITVMYISINIFITLEAAYIYLPEEDKHFLIYRL